MRADCFARRSRGSYLRADHERNTDYKTHTYKYVSFEMKTMHEQCDSVLLDLNVSSNIVQYRSLTRYILYTVRIYLLDKHILILEKSQIARLTIALFR